MKVGGGSEKRSFRRLLTPHASGKIRKGSSGTTHFFGSPCEKVVINNGTEVNLNKNFIINEQILILLQKGLNIRQSFQLEN
jgi:hypothetical protein